MSSLWLITGLIAMLGLAFWYAVRVGQKMQNLRHMEKGQEAAKNINEFNRKADEETDKHIASGGITSPWLRKRK
jgi:hypothetical protein|tara:strand:+ start:277 stop:498 length:222 start_codon:yes stop_codon:yes gene_type:complete